MECRVTSYRRSAVDAWLGERGGLSITAGCAWLSTFRPGWHRMC